MKKLRNKISVIVFNKINARFDAKLDEFLQLSLDELKTIFNEAKMSKTDRHALVKATDILLKRQITELSKEIGKESNNKETI